MSAPKFVGFGEDNLKTSDEWSRIYCPESIILHPNGWDSQNYQYSFFEEKITYKEFLSRLIRSIVIAKPEQ